MKIKKLILKNYKVFDHLELDFTDKNGQVLDTIVLAGLNGTGKTTILELLTDLMNGELTRDNFHENTEVIIEVIVANECEFPSYITHTEEKPYFPVLKYSDIEKIIVAHIVIKDVRHKREGDYSKDGTLSRIIASNKQYTSKSFSNIQSVGIYIRLEAVLNKQDKKFLPIYNAFLGIDSENIKKYLTDNMRTLVFDNMDVEPRQTVQKQVNNLNQIFNELNIKSKLTKITDKDLLFQSTNGAEITFDELSSGEKTLYYMGFVIENLYINDGVIMVDQPEDSLHPKWQQQITKFFQNVGENNQVILATHSPQIIASVHPESVFVLGVNEETGKVEVINMEKEHKYSFGVEPNRILDEIMGTPVRTLDHQTRINGLVEIIKEVEFNQFNTTIQDVEQAIDALEEDYGKQDATVMRFRNEVRFLKRKALVTK